MKHTLYLITTGTGGTYIGCTKQFEKRKNNHRALANRGKPLQKVHEAIKACGGEFEMVVLRTGDKARMLRLEERAIGILKPSLNVLIGRLYPPETRAKMSLAARCNQRALNPPEETRKKIGSAMRGKRHSPETKAKMAVAAMGNRRSLGTKHSTETKLKMSTAHKGRKVSKETRKKLSLAAKAFCARKDARNKPKERSDASL